MKSLSSKSILDRVKRIEKKYTKSSKIMGKNFEDNELELDLDEEKKYTKSSKITGKHFEDNKLEFDLDDPTGYVTGPSKPSWNDKNSSQLISKYLNARFEQKASKMLSRVVDNQPSQSVANLLGKSEESHLGSNSRCYSSDNSEIMLESYGIAQNLDHPLFKKTQSNSLCMKSGNLSPNGSNEDHISTLKYRNQENKFLVHDARNNTNIPVNRLQMKLDLKFQEEVDDEEIQTASKRSETPRSNSLLDIHLNIFPFESLVNESNLDLNNEGEINLLSNKENLLNDYAADVTSLSQISSSISFPEEIVPVSNSMKTPSNYSVCENSIDLKQDNSPSLNFNLLSIGDLMEDIKSETDTKGNESNKLYILESLPLRNEYEDKLQILDEFINEEGTSKTDKNSVHVSPVNSLVKEKSDNISTNDEIKEDIHSSCESSLLVTPFIQVASDGFHSNGKPDFQLMLGRADQKEMFHSHTNEEVEVLISEKEIPMRTEANGDDATTIDEDIVEELDHSEDGSPLCSRDSEQNERRVGVKYSAPNSIQSLTSNVEKYELVSQSCTVEEEKHFVIQNSTQKSNENFKLESFDSFKKVQKEKKFHDSKLKRVLSASKKTGCHVSCQTNPLLFNESHVFDKKIEEILKSSLLLNPNLANNTMKAYPINVDAEEISSELSSPVERGFHWALNQQVELTKHFIQAEYNMYAMCMATIRELSSDYKPLSIHRHKKKKK